MKRFLIILTMALVTILANAKPPKIAVEQYFDERYTKDKSVSISIFEGNGTYFRLLQIKDNPALVKNIDETISKDRLQAIRYFEQTGEGGKSTVVKIKSNGEIIDIGFQQDPSGSSASLFIKGPEKAFK